MKQILTRALFIALCVSLLAGGTAFASKHQWAGRPLDDLERSIHERLEVLPSYGVFDTVRFEVHDRSVILSGQVTRNTIKHNAERAVKRIAGVDKVVNHIEVLPASRHDDALRMSLYRAIYEDGLLTKYADRQAPPIHIIVRNGWLSLEGVVDSDADRNQVHLRALEITARVTDNLRVAPEGL